MRIWDWLRRFFRWCSGSETPGALKALDARCSELKALHLDLVRQVAEMQRRRTELGQSLQTQVEESAKQLILHSDAVQSLQRQISDLRAVVSQIGKETPKPIHVARNYADVRRFLQENEDEKL